MIYDLNATEAIRIGYLRRQHGRAFAAAAVAGLKEEPSQNLLIYGSSQLVECLRQHNLIGTYRLMVFPVVLGTGQLLLTASIGSDFKLVSPHTASASVLVLTHERA